MLLMVPAVQGGESVRYTDSRVVAVDAGVAPLRNLQKDDPLLITTVSSILKVATSQCPRAQEWPITMMNQSAVSDVTAQT